jgi:hemerythrin-like domain-containing protein
MDALGMVREDHRRLEALLARCEQTGAGSAAERTALVGQLVTALRHHVDEEETLLYPAFRQRRGDMVARATEQHRQIVALADELAATPPGAEAFRPRLRALAQRVRSHLDSEDATLLTALEDSMDDATLLDLGRRLENRRSVVAAQEAFTGTMAGQMTRGRMRGTLLTAAAVAAGAAAVLAVLARRRSRGARP